MRALLFSVGSELFAAPLSALEETIDHPRVRSVPGTDEHARGVVVVRGRRIAAYSAAVPLRVELEGEPGAALVIGGEPPIALLISDVDDVLEVDPAAIRMAPGAEDADGVLLGVVQHGGRLVSVVDPRAIRDVSLSAGARH